MAELKQKSLRGDVKAPTQKVTPFKTANADAEVVSAAVSTVDAVGSGLAEQAGKNAADGLHGDRSLAERNTLLDEVDLQITEELGVQSGTQLNEATDDGSLTQREVDEARDAVFRRTMDSFELINTAITTGRMSQFEGKAHLNRLQRQSTNSVFGSFFGDSFAKGMAKATGSTGRSPTMDLEMNQQDINKQAIRNAEAAQTAKDTMAIKNISVASGLDEQSSKIKFEEDKRLAYQLEQAKITSTSALNTARISNKVAYSTALNKVIVKSNMSGVQGMSQEIATQGLRELQIDQQKILESTKLAGGDVATLLTEQHTQRQEFQAFTKSQSKEALAKQSVEFKKNQSLNKFYRASPSLAYLADIMGPDFRGKLFDYSPNAIATQLLKTNPALAKELGIDVLAPGFKNNAAFNQIDAAGKATNIDANEIIRMSDEIIATGRFTAAATGGKEVREDQQTPKQPKAEKKAAMTIASASKGEDSTHIIDKMKEANGEAYAIQAIDENYDLSVDVILNGSNEIADAIPKVVRQGVEIINTHANANSTLTTDMKAISPDMTIEFEQAQIRGESGAFDSRDPNRIRLVFNGVPADMQNSPEFLKVNQAYTELWTSFKRNPQLWAGQWPSASDAFREVFMNGSKLDPTIAQTTAEEMKTGKTFTRSGSQYNPTYTRQDQKAGEEFVPKPVETADDKAAAQKIIDDLNAVQDQPRGPVIDKTSPANTPDLNPPAIEAVAAPETGVLESIQILEGGFQNNPKDKGNFNDKGENIGTNHGISAPMLTKVLGRTATAEDMQNLSKEEAGKIIEEQILIPNKVAQMPPELQKIAGNMFTMTSSKEAAKAIQRAVGAKEDGIMGPQTIKAMRGTPPEEVVDEYLAYLRTLKSWEEFGKGWTSRYNQLLGEV